MRKLGKVHVHQPSHEPGWTKLQGTYNQTWGALFSSYIFLYYLSCLVFQDAHGQSRITIPTRWFIYKWAMIHSYVPVPRGIRETSSDELWKREGIPLSLTSHYLQCHIFFNMQKCQVRYSFSIQLVVAQCGNKSKDTVLSNSSRDFYILALATSIAFIRVTLVTLQISGTGWCSAAIRPNLPRMYSNIRFVNMKCPGERSSGKNAWTFIPPNLASYNIL